MRSTSPAWKTCWPFMKSRFRKGHLWSAWMRSLWCCMPMSARLGLCGRGGLPDAIASTSDAARPTSSAASSRRRDGTLLNRLRTALRRNSPITWWRSWPATGGRHHPPGDGQSEFTQPQGAGGSVRREDRRPAVGAFHGALHSETRQLVESGGDRDQPVFPPMPGTAKDPVARTTTTASKGMESADEPRRRHHQLAVYAKKGTTSFILSRNCSRLLLRPHFSKLACAANVR